MRSAPLPARLKKPAVRPVTPMSMSPETVATATGCAASSARTAAIQPRVILSSSSGRGGTPRGSRRHAKRRQNAKTTAPWQDKASPPGTPTPAGRLLLAGDVGGAVGGGLGRDVAAEIRGAGDAVRQRDHA